MRFVDGLIEALHEGMFEAPLWDQFVRRLQAESGAAMILLAIRPAGQDGVRELVAGAGPASAICKQMVVAQMREGRVYSADELPLFGADMEAMQAAGTGNLRAVRVKEPGGADAWLVTAGGRAIGSATGALLLRLVPHLRIALRSFSALERERFRVAMTDEAFSRLRIGWLTIDAQCRILECSDNVEQMFQWGGLLRRGRYDRLMPVSQSVDRQLVEFVKDVVARREKRPLAINLSQDPWVDMLVSPLQSGSLSGQRSATAIVYVSGDRRSQADRCEQLADLFGLQPSEARLAWLLAQATSIAESAQTLGLTIETARNYSKKIYAKTGARGQADLVRIVMTSVLALS